MGLCRMLTCCMVALLIISGCGVRQVDVLPLPGGETAIYVKAQTRPFGMAVIDRWVYDPVAGRTILVRSNSSGPDSGLMDALRGMPLPVIP